MGKSNERTSMKRRFQEHLKKTREQSNRLLNCLAAGCNGKFETITGTTIEGMPIKIEKKENKVMLTLVGLDRNIREYEVW